MYNVAVIVRQKLNLNVTRVHDELLDIQPAVSEARKRLRLRLGELRFKLALILHHSDTASAAAGSRLYHNRIADLIAYALCLVYIRNNAVRTRYNRHSRFYHSLAGTCLVTHTLHSFGSGTNKRYPALFAQPREIRVLRQEPEPRVQSVRPRHLTRRDYCLCIEIAVLRGRGTYADRLVRDLRVQSRLVRRGIHRRRLYPKLSASPHYPYCYLAAIGDKYLVEHLPYAPLIYIWECKSRLARTRETPLYRRCPNF